MSFLLVEILMSVLHNVFSSRRRVVVTSRFMI